MLYYVISALCMLVLSGILAYEIIRIARRKGAEHRKAIRDFKKGPCALVYLPAIPLYWVGLVYSGEEALPAFFDAIGKGFLSPLRIAEIYGTGNAPPCNAPRTD